ncbi:GumC family protein [Nodularia spumigena]|uniref:GumC family protein n=1 Tax=Nodularia spumigena TaxID=70799 RepID=UPI002B1FE861|nr:AAA family ATPase [Nodularia spumigena]MEA5612313.1 AAA family ATPase [Nodularia spumigena UHCC 0040]
MNGTQVSADWAAESPQQAQGNVFAMVHRLLRGRYLITIILALVFGLAGAAAGFFSQTPMFRSAAVIEIKPVLPKILFESEQSSVPQMFSSIVAAQANLISQPDVVQYAMESDRWRAVRDRAGISTVEDFTERLRAQNNRLTQQLIFVTFEHEDAEVAQSGNRAIVDAYMDLYGLTDEEGVGQRLAVLEARLNNRLDDRKRLTGLNGDLTRKWKTNDLNTLIQAEFETVSVLTQAKEDLDSRVRQIEQLANGQAADGAGGLSDLQAAEIDSEVAEWLGLMQDLQSRKLEMLAGGWLENHPQVRSIDASIRRLKEQIGTRKANLERGGGAGIEAGGVRLDDLRGQAEVATARLQAAEARQTELVADSLKLAENVNELQDIEADIQLTSRRIDQMRTELQASDIANVRGRVSVVSQPTRPSRPSSDKRIKMAMAGFVGGGGMPVALMMGIGLLSRRIRYSDDSILDAANSRIVGVLPDLGKSLTDRELAEASAFAVHQIRAQLQILHGRDRHAVYSVTSPAPGDGKTSMIIALGLSFAESGDRTLLIDLDLIGRGLSLHFGHPAAPSLADAAAGRGDLTSLVQPSSFDRLSVLPAGLGDDLRISRLSPEVVSRMVELFRNDYETILIDSGPILGSIESGLLAPAVDGVLMVVGRNQLRPLVKRAADQIHAVGGQVIATIFNRASIQELKQSSSSMSVHFSRQASRQAAEQAARGGVKGGTSVGPLGGSLFPARPVESPGGGAAS